MFAVKPGSPMVLGAHIEAPGVNFAVFSRDAESMILCLFESSSDGAAFFEYRLDPRLNKTGDIWHVLVVGIEAGTFYLWRAAGPFLPAMGHRFNRHKALIDPYAKAITGDFSWDLGKATAYDPASPELDLSFSDEDDAAFMPKCVVVADDFVDRTTDRDRYGRVVGDHLVHDRATRPEAFREQKAWLGFCAVTNLLCGEAAEEEGRWIEAETEYAEIIAREPANPWGFMKRALLREKQGRLDQAHTDLAEVLALAPHNPEATELAGLWGRQRGKARLKKPAHGPTAEMKGAEGYLSRPKA